MADSTNRTLRPLQESVTQTSINEAAQPALWLCGPKNSLTAKRLSTLVCMGGSDTAFGKLLTEVSSRTAWAEETGVSAVASYFLGPLVDDRSMLSTFERATVSRPRAR